MAIEETRVCSKCHIEKPITEYTKDRKSYRRDCTQCKRDSTKRWRLKNLDRARKKARQYYKEWRLKNLDYLRKKGRQYYHENKERRDQDVVLWRERNPEHISNYRRQYRKDNLEEIKKKRNKYYKIKCENDLNFLLLTRFRCRIREALKVQHANKNNTTYELTGCDRIELKNHFESLFTDGMSWDNYGIHGWSIDHIIPCASFDLTDPEQQKICFHYSNLQPLWAKDNQKKGAKLG